MMFVIQIYNFLCFLIWLIKRKFNYPNYLLEHPFNINKMKDFLKEENIFLLSRTKIYQIIKIYIIKYNLVEKGIIVSLSGGVDSMVLLYCLIYLKTTEFPKMKIATVSVDYNIRFESNDEMNFLTEYLNNCIKMNLIDDFKIVKVENCSRKNSIGYNNSKNTRKEFEETSKKLRYQGYNHFIKNHQYSGVMLGHHKGDTIENIFTNIMYGRNILDLTVIKPISSKNGVTFYRPMLDYHKIEIYYIARLFNIPYFKDTTPTWSKRGKMRNDIFPLISSVFSKWDDKLFSIGLMSDEVNSFMKNYLKLNYYPMIKKYQNGFSIPVNIFNSNDMIINKLALPELIHEYGVSYFGHKHLSKITDLAKNETFTNINKNVIVYRQLDFYYFIIKKNVLYKNVSLINLLENNNEPQNDLPYVYKKFLKAI